AEPYCLTGPRDRSWGRGGANDRSEAARARPGDRALSDAKAGLEAYGLACPGDRTRNGDRDRDVATGDDRDVGGTGPYDRSGARNDARLEAYRLTCPRYCPSGN